MKRADLSVGMDVLVSRVRDWEQGYQVARYRIVDLGPWVDRRMKWDRSVSSPFRDTGYTVSDKIRAPQGERASGVLAIELDKGTGSEMGKRLDLVVPAQIKATWLDGQATIAAAQARSAERANRAAEERRRAIAEADELVTRAAALGVTFRHGVSAYGTVTREATLTFGALRALLDATTRGES